MTIYDFFPFAGGLGMFIYGMSLMGDGLQKAAGSRLKGILERLTSNKLMGVLVGAGVTMIIQSSSATTVMMIGFVNAGLMNLAQAFGVTMGANIGTTITAQIIAFKISDWAPLFILIGIIPLMFAKKRVLKSIGMIITGFGILFTGMTMMSSALSPLRSSPWFVSLMTSFSNPLYGIAVGTLITCIIQSSSASIGILQALAMQNLVSLNVSVYIIMGCNIGTCITAWLASIGTNTLAKRTAILHTTFNIAGTLLFTIILALAPGLVSLVQDTSPDVSRQIANFHSTFNIITTIALFPFINQMIRFSGFVLKGKPDKKEKGHLLYLEERVVDTPAIAMVQLRKEIARLAGFVYDTVHMALNAFFEGDEDKAHAAIEQENEIDLLTDAITQYVVKVQKKEGLTNADQSELFDMHEIMVDLERMGDHAENIAEYCDEIVETSSSFTADARDEMKQLGEKTLYALKAGIESLTSPAANLLPLQEQCRQIEAEVDLLQKKMWENHVGRLSDGTCIPRAGMIFTAMGIDLERLADHAVNIANASKDGIGSLYNINVEPIQLEEFIGWK